MKSRRTRRGATQTVIAPDEIQHPVASALPRRGSGTRRSAPRAGGARCAALEVEHFAAFEHARREAPGPGFELALDDLAVRGLQVRDQHLRIALQLRELLAELDRVEVLGGDREILVAVRQRGLDDQVAQVLHAVDLPPEL